MINSWVKGLVIYLIISGMVIKLVPGKNYERYISFYIGLVMVIMLAKPVLYFLDKGNYGGEKLAEAADKYLHFDRDMTDRDFFDNYSYIEQSINQDIKEECKRAGCEVDEVSVITDSRKNILNVYVYEKNDADENIIKNIIYDVYKVDYESIYIIRR